MLYHACGHYETVEYDGLRRFAAGHELVVALLQYAASHAPAYPAEDDEDAAEMEAEEAERRAKTEVGYQRRGGRGSACDRASGVTNDDAADGTPAATQADTAQSRQGKSASRAPVRAG